MWDGTTWVDETAYFMSARGSLESVPPNEAFQSGKQIIQEFSVTLDNSGYRFSPDRVGSILYAYRLVGGSYHRRCRILCTVDGVGPTTVFSGYIKGTTEDYKRNLVSFTVWDIGEMLRKKYSTPMLRNLLEHEVVIAYLTLANLVDGRDFISPAYADAHNVTATIDYSSTEIEYSWLDDEPVWDELIDVAQASGSRIYVTKEGLVRYEKGYQWTRTLSSEKITPETYQDFEPEQDDKAFYDEVQVSYTERAPGEAAGELWKLETSRLIYPGKNETITARFKYPAVDMVIPQNNVHYFLRYLNGKDASGLVSIGFTLNAQQADINITNNSTRMVVFAQSRIVGQGIVGTPSEQVKRSFGSNLFNRRLDIRDNPYVQTKLQAEAIADFLAWWYKSQKQTYLVKGLRGVPTRKLGDRVTVVADGATYEGIVIKLDWRINVINGAFAYIQDMRLIQNVFTDSYFIVGVSTLNGAKGVWH